MCDGYPPVQLPDQSSLGIKLGIPVTVTAGQGVDIHACSRSRRSFAFFTQRTRSELAGFFGSTFWERLVLQAAHHEPAIRYAIIAIGSLHEQRAISSDSKDTFALEQYNSSIKSLLEPISQSAGRGVDVCLILCILFASFEVFQHSSKVSQPIGIFSHLMFQNMRGHHTWAEIHIRSGSKLLQETVYDQRTGALQHETLGSKRQPDCYAPLEDLATLLAGLDTQVATVRNLQNSSRDARSSD